MHYSHFFNKKFQHICISLDVNFNESLTNEVVSFEQLGPGCYRVIDYYGEVKYEPEHDKPYNKICVTSKDSDELVHPHSMTRVLVHPTLDSPEAVEGTCNQQRL